MQEYNRYSRAVTNSLRSVTRCRYYCRVSNVDIHLVMVNWWGIAFHVGCRGLGYWSCTSQGSMHWPVPHPSPTCHLLCGSLSNGPASMAPLPSDKFNSCPVPWRVASDCRWMQALISGSLIDLHWQTASLHSGRVFKHVHAGMRPCHHLIIITRARWSRQHIPLSLWQAARMHPNSYVRSW